jgi:hypothetical protein
MGVLFDAPSCAAPDPLVSVNLKLDYLQAL